MISKKMSKSLNEQINKELYSAYLYLSMSAYAENENLKGTAHWMALQAKEETGHAMKFYKYLLEQGARVELQAIERPPVEFKSLRQLFEETLKHERKVTASIHALTKLAKDEQDYATEIALQWFVSEQVEEEANVEEILAKLNMVGADTRGIYLLDRELGARAGG